MSILRFKYRPINEEGRETGLFAATGELTESELILGKEHIPLASIYQMLRQHDRLAIGYGCGEELAGQAIAVYGGAAAILKKEVDRLCSNRWEQARRAELARDGKEKCFRTAKCSGCGASVDLTGFDETPQYYCPFCEYLNDAQPTECERKVDYSVCEECRYFSRPRRFTSFYFFFPCVFFYVYWRTRNCCGACLRKRVWKMFFMNLPFLVGVPNAVAALIRAYGARSIDPDYPELDSANSAAQSGDVVRAEKMYHAMLERRPVAAGIRYNLAHAYAQTGQWQECMDAAHESLADCSNYQPAADLIRLVLTDLGQSEDAEAFQRDWGRIPNGLEGTREADNIG